MSTETDRELLEWAAKAAGIDFEGRISKYTNGEEYFGWNPLTDDGDALRLAVKLGISMNQTPISIYAASYAGVIRQENQDDNPYAATRRAIVRAAAEIGKAMK